LRITLSDEVPAHFPVRKYLRARAIKLSYAVIAIHPPLTE